MYIVYFKKPSSVELAFLVELIKLYSHLNLKVQKRGCAFRPKLLSCTVT